MEASGFFRDLSSAVEPRILPAREKEAVRKPVNTVELNVRNTSGIPVQSTNGSDVDCNRILVTLKSENSEQKQSPTKRSELLN
ncbi:hypothetical protein LOAG_16967 [Loa loa]|uniref:Uncharacterized protein n=1 Tax=Loa loa TaxID=7209 RepID=A0A1S0UKQ2_LOALO|nr:hypothetical protein LOAG_16967 [Loa loa]EJD76006.1 hypothetical protein LOAG_16967 [Loa loa]